MRNSSETATPPLPTTSLPPSTARRRRFACVGTGGRARMFIDPVAMRFALEAEIVGLCDTSLVRATYHQQRLLHKFGYPAIPVYAASDFDRMLRETRPDVVVVCTIDCEHDRYISAALHAGCDVVTEKPMTTTAEKCAAICAAVRETGRTLRVTFNYRWSAGVGKVRELIAAGTIGAVRHVTMEYLLNTSHGADYFRRWHSQKENSGGLLVHKATHHFDLINWWLDAIPAQVFAQGTLAFYGRDNALRRGDAQWTGYPRYHGAKAAGDPFRYDYDAPVLRDTDYERNLYLGAAELESGYVRDQNVFRAGITIEDAMNVMVRYRTGELLSYSLNAFSPYEGFRVAFTGDRGRIEYRESHGAHLFPAVAGNGAHAQSASGCVPELRVLPHFAAPYVIEVPSGACDHSGDAQLQEQIFAAQPPPDLLRRAAGHEQGAASILIGAGANRSMVENRPVDLAQLFPLRPDALRLSQLC